MINELDERLKNLRKTAGLSQSELAERLNVHLQTISKWERGISEPDIAQMSELSTVLGVSLEKLFGAEEGQETFAGNFSAEKLGEYISSLRAQKNESQQQLAEVCSASADAVSRWERGVTCPDVNSLIILAEHFDVPISKLYYAVSDEVATPTVVSARKNRKTVAFLASALAAATVAAATMLTVFLVSRSNTEQTLPAPVLVTVTVDGVEQTVNQNDWFTPQAQPRTGYDFIGWTNAAGETVTFPYKVTESCEFISVYDPHEYFIEYWLNGGSFGSSEAQDTFTVESGEVELSVPQKQGATFEGWYPANDYSGDAVSVVACNAENIVLYAKWSDETYTVRYDLGGGTMYESNPTAVTQSDEIELNNPTRKGYLFLGWYDAQEGGNRVEAVGGANAKNLMLYAKWQKSDAVFTVSYELNGGTQGAGNPTSIKAGDMYELAAPKKTGHEFLGWNTSADGAGEYVTKIYGESENIILYAIFEPKEYLLRYVYEGLYLTDEVNPNYVTFGQSVTLIPVYRYGYDFLGWYDSEIGGELIEVIDESNLAMLSTLYAHFEIITYQIQLNGDGGTFVTSEGERGQYIYTLPFDGAFTLPAAYREGYEFLGWKNAAGERVEKLNISNMANMSLTADWLEKNKTYFITFETNGGTLDGGNVVEMQSGETVALPVPERGGYLFLGWNDKADESGSFHDLAEFDWQNDLTLYAVWQEIKINGSSENFAYTKGAESVTITYCTGSYGTDVDIVFPAVIEGLPVKAIECQLGSRITNDIHYIPYRSVLIPEGVEKLGERVFRYVHVSQPLTIPASVTEIGESCFYRGAAEVYFAEGSQLEIIPQFAFYQAHIPNVLVLPTTVKSLQNQAFAGAYVGGLVLPEGLTSILDHGVSVDSESAIYIPSTVTYVGNSIAQGNIYTSYTKEELQNMGFPNEKNWAGSVSLVKVNYGHTSHRVTLQDGDWMEVYTEKQIVLPERQKQGCNFLGWQNEAGEFVNSVFIPTVDTVLTAVYEDQSTHDGRTRATAIIVKPNESFEIVGCSGEMIYFAIDTEKDANCILTRTLVPNMNNYTDIDDSVLFGTSFAYTAGKVIAYRVGAIPRPIKITIKVYLP